MDTICTLMERDGEARTKGDQKCRQNKVNAIGWDALTVHSQ
jgi:hypothetical protein